MAQVDDFYSVHVQVHFVGHFEDALGVAQQDGPADAFALGFDGGLEHVGVDAFGEDHALWVAACGVVDLAGERRLVAHQFAQVNAVGVPVVDALACHARFHGGLGHCDGHFGYQSRVDGFGDEVLRAEGQIVDVIGLVDHVGHGLLG